MTDPIDEFWLPSVGVYETTPFSVTGADLEKMSEEETNDLEKIDASEDETN